MPAGAHHRIVVVSALVVVLLGFAVRGAAADRFVSVAGSDGANDCLVSANPCGTVGHALIQALSGDVVKVTEGQFVESIHFFDSTTLTLSGGWSPDFSSQDSTTYSILKRGFGSELLRVAASTGDVIDLTVERFTFSSGGAGVVVTSGDDASVTVRFQDCISHRNGSASLAVHASAANPLNLTLSNFRVTSHRAAQGSGAVMSLLALGGSLDVTMDDVTIERNRSSSDFANTALLVTASSGTLSLVGNDVSIVKNARTGITLSSSGTGSCSVALTNARVRDNRRGGIMATGAGTALSLTNSVVARNRSRGDTGLGGLSLLNGVYSIVNSSIRGNRSACCTAGLITDGSVDMTNTILWDNRTVGGPADNLEIDAGASVNVASSDIGPGISGSYNDVGGNISADPLFVGSRDEHLLPGSPAIDTGTCVGAPVTDFDGDPRPSGTGCDMGADEVVP
jgi:hypothetical protein